MVQVGGLAPDFTLTDHHGGRVSLLTRTDGAHRDGPVLVVFIPAAFTPVCHGELRALVPVAEEVTSLVVSCDSQFVLRALADAEGYPFTLLSDFWPHGEVARAYDAFDASVGMPRRVSVLVDGGGRIVERWQSSAGEPRDAADYLRAVRQVRHPLVDETG